MEKCKIISLEQAIASLPIPIAETGLVDEIKLLRSHNATSSFPVLVVLDDDPTGTQTCHGINVLTVWDEQTLLAEFENCDNGFFILTNSRALPTAEARTLIFEICTAVKKASLIVGKQFEFVLRGDSTLRGHFPDEPEVAEQVFGSCDGWILAPFFRQGGRLTINDVHYVADSDGNLVPAAQTSFAQDATFGYKNSNLISYVVEKSKGSISADRVKSISLDDIRKGGSSIVGERLLTFARNSIVVVNAVVDTDMEIFVQGLLKAKSRGKKYIYRTGAAFVSTRLGIKQIAPLTAEVLRLDVSPGSPGGLVIAGSYVPKTTAQLESLVTGRGVSLQVIILDVELLLEHPEATESTIRAAADRASGFIMRSQDVLVMTSRKLITGNNETSSLDIGGVVAAALVLFLRLLEPRPRYIIAKGGITSSDAATKGLRMRRANILGQGASGVPLWQCHEPTSKFPGIPYVVFPGNVGENHTLLDLVTSWTVPEKQST